MWQDKALVFLPADLLKLRALCLPLSQEWLERSTSSQTSPSQRLLAFPPLNFDLGFWEHWLVFFFFWNSSEVVKALPAVNRTTELMQMQKIIIKIKKPPHLLPITLKQATLSSVTVVSRLFPFFLNIFFSCKIACVPIHCTDSSFHFQGLAFSWNWVFCAACLCSDCIAVL